MSKVKAQIEEKDGGYYFPELEIHIIASTQKEARELVKEYHGFDPDEQVRAQQEAIAYAEKADKEAAKLLEQEKK